MTNRELLLAEIRDYHTPFPATVPASVAASHKAMMAKFIAWDLQRLGGMAGRWE